MGKENRDTGENMSVLELKKSNLGKSLKRTKLLLVALISASIALTGLTPAVAAAPTYNTISGNASGTVITITYNDTLGTTQVPAVADFQLARLSPAGGTIQETITAVNINVTQVELTLDRPMLFGQDYLLSYTPSLGNELEGTVSGEFVDPIVAQAADNIVATPSASNLALQSAVSDVTGMILTLTYNGALASDPLPSSMAFPISNVTVPGLVGIDQVSIIGSSIELTLLTALEADHVYEISVLTPLGDLLDSNGDYLEPSFDVIANNVPSAIATLTSTIGTVDDIAETIADIPNGTTLAEFQAAITPAPGATSVIYDADGTTPATELASGKLVIVTAANNTTTKSYLVTVIDAPSDIDITTFDLITDVNAGEAGSATYADAAAVIAALPLSAFANNGAVNVPVTTWSDNDGYDPNTAGTYIFVATLGTLPTGWTNTLNLSAQVSVIVAPAVIPSTNPVFESAATNLQGNEIVLTFSEPLSESNIPARADFTVDMDGGYVPSSDYNVLISGRKVMLDFMFPFSSSNVLQVMYGGTDLQDLETNQVVGFGFQPVTNNVPAPTYDITYERGQGTGTGTAPTALALETGETFTVATNTFERPGYIFDQWGSSVGYFSPGDTFTVATSDITLFAEWLLDLSAYDAAISSVNANDYTAESWATYQEIIQTIFLIPMISTPSDVATATTTVLTAQADLVALAPTTYTITYVSETTTGTVPVQSALATGETFTVADSLATYDGWIFQGWQSGSDSYTAGSEFTVGSSNVILTAIWVLDTSPLFYLLTNLVETDWTPESWATLQAFEEGYPDLATPADVSTAVVDFTAAISALVPAAVPGDLTAYNAALGQVTELNFTEASWAVYQSTVIGNPVSSSSPQVDIDAATNTLIAAQGNLVTSTATNVVGLTESAATSELTDDGFIKGAVSTTAVGATAENDGKIKTQTPAAGTNLARGQSVALVLYAYTAPVETPVVSTPAPFIDYQALLAAKIAADAKAIVDAKAAADAKVAAEKAAADAKIAAEAKAVADAKAAVEAQAAADAKSAAARKAVEDEAAAVEAAVKKAAANTIKISNSGKSRSKISMDLADKYFGLIAYVEVGTSVKGVMKYSVVDYLAIAKADGTASLLVKKLAKGQIVRIKVGKTVVVSKKI